MAKTRIEQRKTDVNEDSLGLHNYLLLSHAATKNRRDIVRFLLDNRYADVNETRSTRHRQLTALVCAAQAGHMSFVHL